MAELALEGGAFLALLDEMNLGETLPSADQLALAIQAATFLYSQKERASLLPDILMVDLAESFLHLVSDPLDSERWSAYRICRDWFELDEDAPDG
jgi:hypothetical protein